MSRGGRYNRNTGKKTAVIVICVILALILGIVGFVGFYVNSMLDDINHVEVPEIQDGIVIIRGVSREAGSRSKIAVYSRDPDVDAVGACIGNRNMRIDTIISELNGEKIDIVKYSETPEEYIAAALAPATVNSVTMVAERACRVTVDPDQLSLAIGREGQNVRLAARLTGYKIDIKAE